MKQSQISNGLFRHDVSRNDGCKKSAFTLAEVLITLGIIGIVAAITIPALNANTHKKELVSAYLKTINVLSNNFKQAESLKETKVNQLETQEEFKTWFEEHLKVVSRSPKCKYDVCLADGSGYNYNNDFVQGCTTDKTEGSSTNALKNSCISLLVDVNGAKGPNKDGKDRYTLWVTKDGVFPEGLTDTCDGLNCGMYTLSTHKIWEGETTTSTPATPDPKVANCSNASEESCTQCNSGYYVDTTNGQCKQAEGKVTLTVNGETKDYYLSDVTAGGSYSPNGKVPGTDWDDYWQGANDVCTNKGMRLPTKDELQGLYAQKGTNGVPSSGWVWSASLREDDESFVYGMLFDNGDMGSGGRDGVIDVLCVGN